MIDRSAFDQQVHDALGHLYDFPFLESSPLGQSLGLRERGEGGVSLHRALVDAIERLKPARDVAPDSAAWKTYRSLHLRYVRALSAGAVAHELGLSARQAQRIQALAVPSVAALLRETYRPHPGDARTSVELAGQSAVDSVPGSELVLDEELAAILQDESPDAEPFPVTLRGAIDTIRPILDARRLALELAIADELSTRIGPRHLIRPAIVQLLLASVDRAGSGRVVITATDVGGLVSLTMTSGTGDGPVDVSTSAETFERRLRVARTLLKGIDGDVQVDPETARRIEAQLPLGHAPTVLVVEDNPQVAQLLARYLSGSPYCLLSAPNGVVGFEIARTSKPSAITLDLLMPHSDGWELLQALKVHPETRHIPVIVCSVLRERELALALGASDFLPKPVTQRAFLRSIERTVMAKSG
jgi:CheY-like chemotaxis protein